MPETPASGTGRVHCSRPSVTTCGMGYWHANGTSDLAGSLSASRSMPGVIWVGYRQPHTAGATLRA